METQLRALRMNMLHAKLKSIENQYKIFYEPSHGKYMTYEDLPEDESIDMKRLQQACIFALLMHQEICGMNREVQITKNTFSYLQPAAAVAYEPENAEWEVRAFYF